MSTRVRESSAAYPLEPLPATTVRRDWATAKSRLRAKGALALTSHDRVEAVLLDPAAYEALVARAEAADRALLDGLTARFDARLSALKNPDAATRLRAAFSREGHFDAAPRAGDSF
ncbi:MAG TPA: hypothetical protein DCM32_08435 [Xanthomonadaceae bacterium]|jgi:PHD/YefM family antitoxin component YafN of YafNO toxin-antitoxin module|nr:hypothetical protein [Xanthomonadaceae bacterium]